MNTDPSMFIPAPAVWPIRVAPLPGEAIDSWLEVYADRLDITVAEMLISAQLMPDPLITRTQQLAPNYVAVMRDDEADKLARSAGLTPQQVHAMTLSIYDGHALRLHPYHRTIARAALWGRGDGSRYCPACLSETGGRWLLRWRLSWTFACVKHHALLEDLCPSCGRQARLRRSRRTVFKPFAKPGSCGNKQDWTPCTNDLTKTPLATLDKGHPFLAAQARINKALHRTENGEGTTAKHVFTDLRALGCWILRRARPGDFTTYGKQVDINCQAYLSDYHHRNAVPGVFAPAHAAVTAAALTEALAIMSGTNQQAISILQRLLRRAHYWEPLIPPEHSGRNHLSPTVRKRIIHATDTLPRRRSRGFTTETIQRATAKA
jgi:hypothetical protein